MKKKVLKMAAVLSCIAILGASFAGCFKKPAQTIATSEAPVTEPSSGVTEIPESPDTPRPVSEDELLAFINNGESAEVEGDTVQGLTKGSSYTLMEMKRSIEEYYLDTFGDSNRKTVVEIDYAIIDCGNDGIPELAILVSGNNAERMDGVDDYYIIKKRGDKLYVVDQYESYYRAWGELNKYGVFFMSGSGGASIMVETYDRVNAEGYHEFIYSAEYEMAMGTPMIYGYELPSDADLPEDYPQFAQDYGTNERVKYSFMPYDYSFQDGSKEYDDYLRKMVYIFHDENGNLLVPSDEYQQLYSDIGVVITDDDNLKQLITERLHELNISEEEMKNPEQNPEVAADWKVAWDGLEAQP